MKKIKLLTLFTACMMSVSLSATYYIAGNGTDDPNGQWCNGSNWGFQELDENNSITFYGVAPAGYGFKITDGQWGTGHEFTTLDLENSDAPLYGGDGNDMRFTLSEEADVTVSYVDGKVQVHATKPLAYRSNYYYIAGNNASMGSWSENTVALENDQITFSNLAAGWYEFKITNGSWSKTWGYTELDVAKSSPMHKTYGEGNNICFRLTEAADVTVKMEKGKVVLLIDREYCVTGIGGWNPLTDKALTQANNYTYTFYTLAAGTYEFKVKDRVSAWSENNDCTWGYEKLDTDHSNAGEDESGNIKLTLALPADVTISIVDNKIRVNISPVYFIVGNGAAERGDWCNQKNWWTDDANSRLDVTTLSKTYTDLPAGTYEFKLTTGKWVNDGGNVWAASAVDFDHSSRGYRGAGDEGNIEFDLQEPTDVTISFDPATEKISIVSSNGYFLSNVYSVVGEVDLTGFDWKNMETSTEMTNNGDGTYTYTINDKYLAADNYEYKIIGGHRWGDGCEYPNTNATLSIAEDGYYNIVFTLNPVAETQTCVATPVTEEITISQYQFNTFYSDKAYNLPEGLTAFIYTGIQNDLLVMQTINPIPANTGVVLYGAANQAYSLTRTNTDVTYPENMLQGTVADETIDNSLVHYILSLSDQDQVGLFWPKDTDHGVGAFTNHGGKAYLELPGGSSSAPAHIRGFILTAPNVATGVEETMENDPMVNGKCYDVLGREVANPQQGGIYIMNGKKEIIF